MPQKNNQKLELTWVGKGEEPKLEPRILIEHPEYSYGDPNSENILIHGDNLLALKALEQEYAGRVKCIYIDPPYNTGSAFEHYDDGLEHSLWLNMMKLRLDILWKLLTPENGVLLISINDDEAHYLKVICDEIFGRKNFIASLVWNYEGNTDNQAKIINYHEYILVYSKSGKINDPEVIDPNISPNSKIFKEEVRNTIVKNGPKNPPKTVTLPKGFPAAFQYGTVNKNEVDYPRYDKDLIIKDYKLEESVSAHTGWSSRDLLENFINNDFKKVKDTKGQLTKFEVTQTGAIEAVKKRHQKKGHFISVLRGFGTTNQMRLLLKSMGISFTYPKPVELIKYLIEAFTNKDDIVLDSFAGSGTTAHSVMKLNHEKTTNRKFILVELDEENAHEVIIPRLKNLVDGNRSISIPAYKSGFRFYTLAPSLLKQDRFGNWVISEEYNAEMLAAAVAKQEGFTFEPHPEVFWKQGYSTEQDFIYTTTQFVTVEMIDRLQDEMKPDESLLIMCKKFQQECRGRHANITVKKIPQALRSKCEYGKEDYSLNIVNLPLEREEEPKETGATAETAPEQEAENEPRQQTLF